MKSFLRSIFIAINRTIVYYFTQSLSYVKQKNNNFEKFFFR